MRILAQPWRLEKTGTKTRLYLNDQAIQQSGKLRFIDLPAVGAVLKIGMPFISLEGSRLVDTLDSPIACRVVKVNPQMSGWLDPQTDPSQYLIEVQAEL